MRFMLMVRFAMEAGNAAVSGGQVAQLLQSAMEQLTPEGVYFGPIDGNRGCFLGAISTIRRRSRPSPRPSPRSCMPR